MATEKIQPTNHSSKQANKNKLNGENTIRISFIFARQMDEVLVYCEFYVWMCVCVYITKQSENENTLR